MLTQPVQTCDVQSGDWRILKSFTGKLIETYEKILEQVLLHPSETTTTEKKRQNTDVPEKNPGKDLLHPSETTTTEKKRQNTDVPESKA
ncbi:PREDICTED: uncharacterized protein LOC107348586 isoform X2 [Acropora digitifera]|uniref:uncharacterized protein LOC107348586 isoform X2 n=1 Tax=Acropora digitifera TaxID=70779 RepID=UPI00077AEA71|nr:PREDICTED: uncharacterized protein LOC107348586 isoform X2 [Acropora digitifera]